MPLLRLLPEGDELEVERGVRLIDAIRRAGRPIGSACGDALVCGRCGVRIVSGEVRPEGGAELRSKRRNRLDPSLRLACAVRVYGDLTVQADYWGHDAATGSEG